MVRDERWGRTYEGFGETPELAKSLGEAAVRGLQGNDLSNPLSVLACAKHFVGDGGTQNGINENNTVIPLEGLLDIHMPAYLDSIRKGVATVMVSYSSWNGVKMHANHNLVTGFLKKKLKFRVTKTNFILASFFLTA